MDMYIICHFFYKGINCVSGIKPLFPWRASFYLPPSSYLQNNFSDCLCSAVSSQYVLQILMMQRYGDCRMRGIGEIIIYGRGSYHTVIMTQNYLLMRRITLFPFKFTHKKSPAISSYNDENDCEGYRVSLFFVCLTNYIMMQRYSPFLTR